MFVFKQMKIFMLSSSESLHLRHNSNFFRVGSNVTASNTGKLGSRVRLLSFIALNLILMKTLVQQSTSSRV